MGIVRLARLFLLSLPLVCLAQQAGFYALEEVRAGQRGVGKTVFSGNRIEDFDVEILGVLENVGPRQSLVLARLSGGPLAQTGLLQGMSGSPVYVNGRLLGAVAMAFPWAKEPIAAIRPIQEMLRVEPARPEPARRAAVSLFENDLTRSLEPVSRIPAGGQNLVDIGTPLVLGGFTRRAVEQFTPQLRALGLEPQRGASGGGAQSSEFGDVSALQPGSMISVQLLAGDMSVGAEGTVTHVEGRKVYAFGHRLLSIGNTDLPFSRAEVMTLLPTLNSSFKIAAARELMGAITADRSTAVAGELGRRAALVPVSVTVARGAAAKPLATYNLRMASDSFLSPLLLQMAVFSAIDATERTVGASTVAIRGEIQFAGGAERVRVSNMYSGEFNIPLQASLAAAVPLAYALQSGFPDLKLQGVSLHIDSYDEKRQMQISQVWASRHKARPGDSVELTMLLSGASGEEVVRKWTYRVPTGSQAGPLNFTVADGLTTNLTEFQQFANVRPKSAAQVLTLLNSLKANTKAYVRVWRPVAAFAVEGRDLPAPPASVSVILSRDQMGGGAVSGSLNSKVAECEIEAGDVVVTGSQTVQVEIQER